MPASPTYSMHPGLASQLVELVARWDVTPSMLLGPLHLTEATLLDPGTRLSVETTLALFRRARQLTGEPGLGIYVGLERRLWAYGYLGLAASSAATLGQAVELVVRFSPTIASHATVELEVDGEHAALAIDEHVDLLDVRDMLLLSVVVGLRECSAVLVGHPVEGQIDLAIAEPDYWPRFAHLLGTVRFEMPRTRVVFPARALELSVVSADRVAHALVQAQCERTMEELGFSGSFAARVRRLIADVDGFRSIEGVASQLALSTRTLKRRLAESGDTYSELLDDERRQRAMRLVGQSELSLPEVASQLGYETPRGFSRAFRRWTGTTPSEYRIQSRG